MPDKVRTVMELAEQTARRMTGSGEQWMSFLTTAARLYKYPYQEQLLIYAQRPEATACATYELWNRTMRRYVRRGAKGIALLDTSGETVRLRYVFDVADTGQRAQSRSLELWRLTGDNAPAVAAFLEAAYGAPAALGLDGQLQALAIRLADACWEERGQEILGIVDGFSGKGYDEDGAGASFRKAAAASLEYVLRARCGLDNAGRFTAADFDTVPDWSEPEAAAALGTAVSERSGEVLRNIETTIRNHERSVAHERDHLPAQRGLPAAQPDAGGNGGPAPGQVRADAQDVPAIAPEHAVEQPAAHRETPGAPYGDRDSGAEPAGATDATIGGGSGGDGGAESPRSPAVDGPDERLQGAGRGDHPGGAGVQLGFLESPVLPGEAEQIALIDQAESETPSAFSIPQETVDRALQTGGNAADLRLQVALLFLREEPADEIAAALPELYRGGNGLRTPRGDLSVWFGPDGVRMAYGHSARFDAQAQRLTWPDAAARIARLLEEGRYATREELTEAPGYARRTLARSLRYLYYDIASREQAEQAFPLLATLTDGSFAEDMQRLDQALADRDFCAALSEELTAFRDALREHPELLRLSYHRLDSMQEQLAALRQPLRAYAHAAPETPQMEGFITEDEIRQALVESCRVSGGLERIDAYFRQHAAPRDRAVFLSETFGIGGRAHALSGAAHSAESHDRSGIRLQKGNCPEVRLTWHQAAVRLDELMRNGRYRESQEQDSFPEAPEMTPTAEAPAQRSVIAEERFFTPEEQDEEIHPAAIRQALEARGIVGGQVVDQEKLDSDPFLRQVMADAARAEAVRETAEPVGEKPEAAAMEKVSPGAAGTVYPGVQNQLPFDVVVEPLALEQSPPETPLLPARNFRITDSQLGVGGAKTRYGWNITAIRTLQTLEAEGRPATPQEQEVLSRYVGWGGIPQAFDAQNTDWRKEYEELRSLLPDAAYASARASTLNAHYTSPTVIRAIYQAVERMGFRSGNILEPSMGVGNFFGLLPDTMAGSRLYGVELDSVTGRIARYLYPEAHITVAGFETTDRRDFFDLAVGNVPFGNYQVADKAYDKLRFNIHDYFFAKAIDQVRPGGIIAFVTSKGTMDKQNPDVRRYLARRAELLGAIRLPNNAFARNANTEVTSDILFLQKRDRPLDVEPDWVHLGQTDEGIPVNAYFAEHPEMVLGRMAWDDSMYGNRKETACLPLEDADLAEQLAQAVERISGTYREAETPDLGEGEAIAASIPADPAVKNYSYTLVDGQVYYRENSVMVRPALSRTAQERIGGLVGLRDCTQALIALQMDATVSDSAIQEQQAELNRRYDAFTARYGLISDRANRLAFADDSSYYLLCALEVLDEDGKLQRKADMFTKRTIRPAQAVEHVDTPGEALALSIAEKAGVDLSYMAQLTGKSPEELTQALQGVIFPVPGSEDTSGMFRYETADAYLSGNVRQKLRDARQAAESDARFAPCVAALEHAQPKDLDASEIDVRLGATWVDKAYIRQFALELLKPPLYMHRLIQVNFSALTAEWQIPNKGSIASGSVAANVTYGTSRANAYRILEDTLNLRDIRIYDTVEDADGKERRVLNTKETTLAQQKQQAIKDAFRDWIWQDAARRETLVTAYNERFNATRPREFDGSHITFGGMNPEIALREHQRNAVAHILYGGNTLLAHEVGSGKTFEMVAACMESKRLGLCRKSLFAVPNHLTEQWAAEFLRLYPSANILVATKKDFETRNRKKFCARIATGDYDAIIIGHSQFERIPISQERQQRLLREQIDEIVQGIEELKRNHGEQFTIKQLERTRKQLESRLEKLTAAERKDDVVTFEQLGVDRLYVDEAHLYKNLFLFTKMRNVAGLSTADAQKSSDMFAKCRYMDELTGGKGVIFATGTPVSNSMTEMYTMQRYLQYGTLQRNGLTHFDAWASIFGETVTAIELAPEGTGYRARTRFARFFNLPELIALFKEVADIKTADQLHLPTPKACYETIAVKPSAYQQEMVQALSERASAVHAGNVDPKEDNMLKITSDGRKLGLDQRLINPLLPDDPHSKVNACVQNVYRIWREGREGKLTQLIFSDISTPKGEDGTFNVYDDIRAKLTGMGVPAAEIAFIHEANTEAKKKELFARVRSGQVRVLLGSTAKMGSGTNVQDLLIALHDLDCPWRPGDLEQRAGRIVRQGNRNPEVHIYRYVTEGTFDAYLWQTIENKQAFISQIMTSKSPVRSCEDVDETALSYAEIKALCAGDARIREKMDLDVSVARLRLLKADHMSRRYQLEDQLLKTYPREVERCKDVIAGLEKDKAALAAHPLPEKEFVGMEIQGRLLTDRDAAGQAILEACKGAQDKDVELGTYRTLRMTLSFDPFGNRMLLTLRGAMSHPVELGTDARGNLIRMENALDAIPRRIDAANNQLQNLLQQMEAAKAEIEKPFPQEEELQAKSQRLSELDAALNMDSSHASRQENEPERASVLERLRHAPHSPEKQTKATEREVDF